MTVLERHCRLLLRVYPAAYRRNRGDEIIGTLLESTPEGRSWPVARDVRSLVTGGFRARAAQNRRLTTAANLRIAALTGVAAYLAFTASAYVSVAARQAGWPTLLVAALVGVAVTLAWVKRRRSVVLGGVIAAAIVVSLAGSWRSAAFGWPATELSALAALALLAGRDERPGRRWLWLLALVIALPVLSALPPGIGTLAFGSLLAAGGIVSLLWVVIDARPAIAAAVFLLAFWLPSGIDNLARGVGVPGAPLLVIVTLVMAFAVWRLHRQSARVTAGS